MKKKILFILQGLGYGGVPVVITTYYRKLHEKYDADFLIVVKQDEEKTFIPELKSYGCNIFYATPFTKNCFLYSRDVARIIKKGNYDIVHDNDKYFGFLSLFHAKRYGVPLRISHVHNTIAKNEKNLFHRMFITVGERLTRKFSNSCLACSDDAGKSMYGNRKYTILNNAIEVSKYEYNDDFRVEHRKILNIEPDDFVIIVVARNDGLKRHDIALKAFDMVSQQKKNAKLVFVGFTVSDIQGRVKDVYDSLDDKTKEKILFLGRRSDANELLSAADLFLLTSEHEGFGIAVVEAQANGLPCVVSTGVPNCVQVTDLVRFVQFTEDPDQFAHEILTVCPTEDRSRYAQIINDSNYAIQNCIHLLDEIYMGKDI